MQTQIASAMIGKAADEALPAYVVDDNEADRAAAIRLATACGLRVRAFAGGQAVLDALPQLVPGVVMLDVMMPDVDGAEVLDVLMKRDGGDSVVMMSAQADVATAVTAMRKGAQDFLLKPLDEMETKATLQRAVQSLRDAQTAAQYKEDVDAIMRAITPKEMCVLRKLIAGKRNKNIAHELGVSERTVEVHRARLIQRVESGTFAGLIAFAVRAGVEPDTE